jgi:hypothetical protein
MILATLIALVIVLVAMLSAFLYFNGLLGENPRYSHPYHLTVEPNSTADFSIICPVPINSSGSLYPDFVSEIEVVSGDPEYLLIETEHGYGLQVSGSGYTKLTWEGRWKVSDGDWYLNLTMTNAPCQWDYDTPDNGFWSWIHSSNEPPRMRLSYSADRIHNEAPWFISGGGPNFRIAVTMTQEGWCQVLLDWGWKVIN